MLFKAVSYAVRFRFGPNRIFRCELGKIEIVFLCGKIRFIVCVEM